jgi:hypothetical protein
VSEGISIRELWSQTSAVLGARHEARWICEVAVALDGDEFDRALDEPVTARMVAHLDAMVARYRAGEPLQYVLGRWGFRRLDLAIDRRVLIPRPETELLADAAIRLAAAVPGERVVADLGTGSGAIGLAMADELPLAGTTVWITDVSDDALAVARANLAGIGRAARNVLVAAGSWFDCAAGRSALPRDREQSAVRRGGLTAARRARARVGTSGCAVRRNRRARRDPPPGRGRARPPRRRRLAAARARHGPGHCGARALPSLRLPRVETDRDLAGHDRITRGRISG